MTTSLLPTKRKTLSMYFYPLLKGPNLEKSPELEELPPSCARPAIGCCSPHVSALPYAPHAWPFLNLKAPSILIVAGAECPVTFILPKFCDDDDFPNQINNQTKLMKKSNV